MGSLVQVLLSGGLGTVVGAAVVSWLGQGRERRAARADVREKVAEVEALRWADEPYQDFRRAVAALEAAAIVARVPRPPIRRYVHAAEAARGASVVMDDVGPNGEAGGVLLDHEKKNDVDVALEGLSFALWHPSWSAAKAGAKSARIAADVGRRLAFRRSAPAARRSLNGRATF
jgi:hypothetical protein